MFVVLPLVQAAFVLLVLFFQRRTNEESEDGTSPNFLLQDAISWSALDDAVPSTPSFMEESASGAAARRCVPRSLRGAGRREGLSFPYKVEGSQRLAVCSRSS